MSAISLKKIYSGKVRDLYEIDDKRILMVASDRLSAFDVILDDPIPGKGEILTQISNFWFRKLAHIMPNHFTGDTVYDVLPESEAAALEKRAVVVKKLTPVKVEAIVRGYLAGSGWKDYRKTGAVCGIKLPEGLQESQQLPEAVFTPSTKAAVGNHDENISFEECERIIGKGLAAEVRAKAIRLYTEAAGYAKSRGVIFLMNLALGFLTPPIGMDLFIASYTFNKPVIKIVKNILPFLGVQSIILLLVTYIPWLTTALLQ